MANSITILTGKSLLIQSDNSTAVAYINKMGGTCSRNLCYLSLKIWAMCLDNKIDIHAIHIAGKNNSSADYLSRFSNKHEYSLAQSAFDDLALHLPFNLEIDLFASYKNHKLKQYVSILHVRNSYQTDAFSLKWSGNIYCFPPIPLINKTVHKIQSDKVEKCLLITPAWDSLSCVPTLMNLLIEVPIVIDASFILGYLPTRRPFPWMAWPISGNCVRGMVSLRRLQTPFSEVSHSKPLSPIQQCGKNLLSGLLKNQIVPKFL